MNILLISYHLRPPDDPKWLFWPWTQMELPPDFKTFDAIILDFTEIQELIRVERIHIKLMDKIPKLLEESKILIIAICGTKDQSLYLYDPKIEDSEENGEENKENKSNSSSIYPGRKLETPINVYAIFEFLSDMITIKTFLTEQSLVKAETYPTELDPYLSNKIKKKIHVFFELKYKATAEILAYRQSKNIKVPVSLRLWYQAGEIIFLPGYDKEAHPKTVISAIQKILELKQRPEWFIEFSSKYMPKLYQVQLASMKHIKFVSEMVYETGDYRIESKGLSDDSNDHLVERVRLALCDIFEPIGGKVIISSQEQDRAGIDLLIDYENNELIIQVKGLEKNVRIKDLMGIKQAKYENPEKVALFIVNTYRLIPFEDRIQFPIEKNFEKRILDKDHGVILMTIKDLYFLWKACIDGKLKGKQIVENILNWDTSKVFIYPFEKM